jgi:hypothetical protein
MMDQYHAINWIGSSNNTAPSIERSMNASFSNGNGSLLHDFMDGDLVEVTHPVKPINGTPPHSQQVT